VCMCVGVFEKGLCLWEHYAVEKNVLIKLRIN